MACKLPQYIDDNTSIEEQERLSKVHLDIYDKAKFSGLFTEGDGLTVKSNEFISPEQNKNIEDLKAIEPAYANYTNEQVKSFIESKIPNSKIKEVVFHISKSKIKKFDKKYLGSETSANDTVLGFFFTDNLNAIQEIAKDKEKQLLEMGVTKEVLGKEITVSVLNIKNPIYYNGFTQGIWNILPDFNITKQFNKDAETSFLRKGGNDYFNRLKRNGSKKDYIEVKELIEKNQQDGVVGALSVDMDQDGYPEILASSIVAFEPEQIIILNSPETIAEFKAFVNKNNKLTPEQNKNINDLKEIEPSYKVFLNSEIQYAIEQLIPDKDVLTQTKDFINSLKTKSTFFNYKNEIDNLVNNVEDLLSDYLIYSHNSFSKDSEKSMIFDKSEKILISALEDLDKELQSNYKKDILKAAKIAIDEIEKVNYLEQSEKSIEKKNSILTKYIGVKENNSRIAQIIASNNYLQNKMQVDFVANSYSLNSPETFSKIRNIINNRNQINTVSNFIQSINTEYQGEVTRLVGDKLGINALSSKKIQYQKNQTNSNEGIIASEKTIRDLAATMSDRIGMPIRFEADKTKNYKGKIENGVAYINLAYATLDTAIHEILGHPIIRAIKYKEKGEKYKNDYLSKFYLNNMEYRDETDIGGNYTKESKIITEEEYKKAFFQSKEYSQLYQNLLKELETGVGKEVLDRIKKDYVNKENIYTQKGQEVYKNNVLHTAFFNEQDAKEYIKENSKYTLEEQQEEALVELLGLMTANKLDNVKDGKLISLLKRLLKEMKAFIRSLLNQKEVEIDKLPDNMTLGQLSDLLAYSNSKLILPGYEVEYTTPDNVKHKTYQEASNHVSKLAQDVKELDLNNLKLQDYKNVDSYIYGGWKYFKQNEKDFIEEPSFKDPNDINRYISTSNVTNVIKDGKMLSQDWEYIKEQYTKFAKDNNYTITYKIRESEGSFDRYMGKNSSIYAVKYFIEKNKEYEQSKEIIEEWKKVNNIQYNPEEIYSRGQEFVSIVGAYSNFDVNLMMQNLLHHIEDNEKAGGKFAISAITKPVDRKIEHLEGGGGKIKFKINPQSQDILWASNQDVYSGSVWDASEKVNKDKKSELLGVSYTKYPSLNSINTVQSNLAAVVDNLAHHHNELGIVLTGNNFRLEYDEDIPYSTKKIIDGVNNILDQKYGKLVKPEIRKSKINDTILDFLYERNGEYFYNDNSNDEISLSKERYDQLKKESYNSIQPTQTNETLKESIDSVKNKTVKYNEGSLSKKEDFEIISNNEYEEAVKKGKKGFELGTESFGYSETYNYNGFIYTQIDNDVSKEMFINEDEYQTGEVYGKIKINSKEYTSQALINTKIAALKEVAKKYPRSLIRSEVKPIKGKSNGNFGYSEEEMPFQKISSDLSQATKDNLKSIQDLTNVTINYTNEDKSYFDGNTNSININMNEVDELVTASGLSKNEVLNFVVNHEIGHAQTEYALANSDITEFEKLLKEIIKVNENNPFEDVLRGGFTINGKPRAFANVSELIADYYSNPYLITWLQSNKKNNLFHKLLLLIKKALNSIGIIKSTPTLYQELTALIESKKILIENTNNSINRENPYTIRNVVEADIKTTIFDEFELLMKVDSISNEFRDKLPEMLLNIKNMRKLLFDKQKFLQDTSIKNSVTILIKELEKIEDNPNDLISIVKQIFNISFIFKKLKAEAVNAQKITNESLKLRVLYELKEMAEEHEPFLILLSNIRLSLEATEDNNISMLTNAISKDEKLKNTRVEINLTRVLSEPRNISNDIKSIFMRNYESIVENMIYTDLESTATEAKLRFEQEILDRENDLPAANIKNQRVIKDKIASLKEKIKKLPLKENNNVKDLIAQINGDMSFLNLWVESNTISRSTLVQTLSSKIKDNELRTKEYMQQFLNQAQTKRDAYLKATNQTNIDTEKLNDPFLYELTVIDSVIYNEDTKEFDVVSHKQLGLINEYTDEYQYELNLLKKKETALQILISQGKDLKNVLESVKEDKRKFYKESVQNRYIKQVQEGFELLEEIIDGTTLSQYRGNLYQKLEEAQQQRDTDSSLDLKKIHTEAVKELQILVNDISVSRGKKESSIEYKMAIQAQKYRDIMAPYKKSVISLNNENFYRDQYELKKASLLLGSISKEDYDIWVEENTRIEISEEFYDKRKMLSETLEELRKELIKKGVLQEKNEKLKDGYITLRDINKKYREFDGVINGNRVEEEERIVIKEIQEEIERLNDEFKTKKSGLTKNQEERFFKLSEKTTLSESESEEFKTLNILNQIAKILLAQNKVLFEKYQKVLAELSNISTGGKTRYYEEKISDINQEAKNIVAELLTQNLIVVDETTGFTLTKVENTKDWETNKGIKLNEELASRLLYNNNLKRIKKDSEWFQKNHFKAWRWVEDKNNENNSKYEEIDEPLYQWKTSRPTDETLIKERPALKYYNTEFKSNALNPEYKVLPNNLPNTKNSKYVNPEYTELLKNKETTDYLEFLRSLFYKFQLEADDKTAILGDLIPTARKSGWENTVETVKGNWLNNIKEVFTDAFTSTEQDIDKGYVKEDNIANKVIPTHLVSKIESKNQSKDILGLVLEYGYFSERRKGIVDLQAFAESLKLASAGKPQILINNTIQAKSFKDKIKVIAGVIKGNKVTTVSQGVVSNETQAIQQLINKEIYGQERTNIVGSVINKTADTLMRVTAKGIFFLNVFSPLKNTLSAKLQFYISTIASPKEWAKAESTFIVGLKDLFQDINKFGNKSYLGQILEKFEGLQGSVFDSITAKVQANPFKEGANIFGALKQFSEYELQAVFTLVMLQKEKVKQGKEYISLFDAYESTEKGLVLKQGVNFPKQNENDFIKRLHKINLETQGAYRKEEKNNAQKGVGGRLLFFMSQYFVPGITKRYSSERYYRATGEFEEGFYRTAWKKLFSDWIKYGSAINKRWPTMSETEKLAVIKFAKEVTVILSLLFLAALLGGGDDDRYKNLSKSQQFALALILGVSSETQTFSPIGGADEILRKIQNPFIVSRTLNNVAKLIILTGWQITGSEDAYYKQNSGIHEKGDSKAFATLMKLSGFTVSNVFLLDGEELLKRQENITRLR